MAIKEAGEGKERVWTVADFAGCCDSIYPESRGILGVFDTKHAAWELAERRVAPPHSSSTFSMQCPGLTDSVPIAVERSLSFRRKATRRAQDVQRNGGGEGEEEGSYLYLTARYAASKRATRCLILTCLAVACEPPERKEDGWYWWRSNVHGNRWRVQEHLVG